MTQPTTKVNKYFRPDPRPVSLGFTNFFLVETIVPVSSAAATRISLNDQPFLRDKLIVSLEMYTSTDIPNSNSQTPLATAAQLSNLFLTLYSDTIDKPGDMGEWYQGIPFPDMHIIQNSNNESFVRPRFTLSGPLVSWDKCYYTLGAALGNGGPVSILLSVGFLDPERFPTQLMNDNNTPS